MSGNQSPYHVPPSLHEAMVERHIALDPITRAQLPDTDISGLAAAMAASRRSAEQIAELARMLLADQSRTPEAAALELRKNALAVGEKAARVLDTARARVGAVIKLLDAETFSPPPPRDAVALALESEVRGTLARMTPEKRRKAIALALNGGDETICGAVLRAPAMLTGMDDNELAHTRLRWRLSRHPEKAGRMERLQKAAEDADRGGNLLMSFIEKVSNSPAARIAQSRADAATRAIASLQSAE